MTSAPIRCSVSGKIMFDKRSAQTAANKRYDDDHVELRIYECPYCHRWHLTHTQVRQPYQRKR